MYLCETIFSCVSVHPGIETAEEEMKGSGMSRGKYVAKFFV